MFMASCSIGAGQIQRCWTEVALHRWALFLCGTGICCCHRGSLIPIEGRNIHGSEVSVSCGPALPGAMHWTGPPERGGQTIMMGSGVGLTTSAWCEAEAGLWLRSTYLAGAALLVVEVFLVHLQAARAPGLGRCRDPGNDRGRCGRNHGRGGRGRRGGRTVQQRIGRRCRPAAPRRQEWVRAPQVVLHRHE